MAEKNVTPCGTHLSPIKIKQKRRLPTHIPVLPGLMRSISLREPSSSITPFVEAKAPDNEPVVSGPVKLCRGLTISAKSSSVSKETEESNQPQRSALPLGERIQQLRNKYRGVNLKEPGVNLRNTGTHYYAHSRTDAEDKISRLLGSVSDTRRTSFQVIDFNWHSAYEKVQKLANDSSNHAYSCRIINSFHYKLNFARTLLDQINVIFQDRQLPAIDDLDLKMNQLCSDMDVVLAGRRGRATPNISWIDYMSDLFKYEISKANSVDYKPRNIFKVSNDTHISLRLNAVKWITDATKSLKYAAETAHLAVNIMDAYKAWENTNSRGQQIRNNWSLYAVASFLIAAKHEEPNSIDLWSLHEMATRSGIVFKFEDLKNAEIHVLTALRMEVNVPLAPVLASMILVGGGLEFPKISIRKVVMDLTQGVLLKSLRNHEMVAVSPVMKAKAALEASVEFVFFHYDLCHSRDLSTFTVFASSDPGRAMGDFALNTCLHAFNERVAKSNISNRSKYPAISRAAAINCNLSPVRTLKV